tara:strand:+ start:3328 stop:3777 length:450 start_codon:yes stop_codon:yes gene_type:complete
MRYIFLILLFVSCNPVKQVLRNQEMLEEVAKVVVKNGWCANDTTYIVKSDTTTVIDTLVEVYPDVEIRTVNDTTYVTEYKTKTINKTLTIRDTIKSYIVDNSRIRLLEADSTRLSNLSIEYKAKADSRLNWLISLLVLIALFIYLKLRK